MKQMVWGVGYLEGGRVGQEFTEGGRDVGVRYILTNVVECIEREHVFKIYGSQGVDWK